MDDEEFQARWRTQRLALDEVESQAVRWLDAGFDGPALRELAWRQSSWAEVDRLLVAALGELGRPVMSEADARYWWAADVARRIVDGTLDPYEGAEAIYWTCWEGILPRPRDIARFYDLALEAVASADPPAPTPGLKARIREEARTFLLRGRGGGPTP